MDGRGGGERQRGTDGNGEGSRQRDRKLCVCVNVVGNTEERRKMWKCLMLLFKVSNTGCESTNVQYSGEKTHNAHAEKKPVSSYAAYS